MNPQKNIKKKVFRVIKQLEHRDTFTSQESGALKYITHLFGRKSLLA